MISEIIKKLKETNIKVCPFGIDEKKLKEVRECILYTYNPIATSNKFQLEIRVISDSLESCLEIKKELESLFLGKGDKVNLKKCTYVEFTGGGSLKDFANEKVHLFFYMNFIGRR